MPELYAGSSIFEQVPVEITANPAPRPAPRVDPKPRPLWAKEPLPAYQAKGMTGWMEEAATKLGLTDRHTFGNISGVRFVKEVSGYLSTLSGPTSDVTRKELTAKMLTARLAVAVMLDGLTAAMQDAAQKLGLELPPFSVEPALPFTVTEPIPLMVPPAPSCIPPTDDEPTEETEDVDTGHVRGTGLDHQRDDVHPVAHGRVGRVGGKPNRRKSGHR